MRRAPGLRHLVAMSMLELRQVSKVYGQGAAEVHALREVSLEVDPGTMVAVMGPSGSGKSTLLTIAGSLEEPTSGQVLVAGQDLATMSRNDKARLRRQSIGYVFQDFNLLPGLTAAENVALPLELDGISARKAREAGLRALDRPGPGGPRVELPGPAVRRRTPAGRDRPRGGRRPAPAAGRRAVRRAGLGQRRGGDAHDPHRVPARRRRRGRHARRAARRVGGPGGVSSGTAASSARRCPRRVRTRCWGRTGDDPHPPARGDR